MLITTICISMVAEKSIQQNTEKKGVEERSTEL